MRRVVTAAVALALLAGAAFAYANLSGSVDALKAPRKTRALTITGHIENLQPGVPTTMTVSVRNNLRHRVRMRSLKLAIGDAGPECPGSMLITQRVRAKKSLRARKTRKVPVTVMLSPDAPDACQNATFPIKYRAKALLRRHAR